MIHFSHKAAPFILGLQVHSTSRLTAVDNHALIGITSSKIRCAHMWVVRVLGLRLRVMFASSIPRTRETCECSRVNLTRKLLVMYMAFLKSTIALYSSSFVRMATCAFPSSIHFWGMVKIMSCPLKSGTLLIVPGLLNLQCTSLHCSVHDMCVSDGMLNATVFNYVPVADKLSVADALYCSTP